MNNWPLGNEPPVQYDSPSPTDSSNDGGDDEEVRYLPRMDMMLAARSSERDALRLARREQRRKEAYVRENPRVVGEDQAMEDAPRVEEGQAVERTRWVFFKRAEASLEDVERRMRGMSGAYPRSPPSGGEGGLAMEEMEEMEEITKGGVVGTAAGGGKKRATRAERSRPPPPQSPSINPDFLRPSQPPPPSRKKKTPPQPLPSYQELLARRDEELGLLDARMEEEKEALQERYEQRLKQAARGPQPFDRYREVFARKKRELAELDECGERARGDVKEKWEERLDLAAQRVNGGVQPSVEEGDDVDDVTIEGKAFIESTRQFGYPPLNPELFRPVQWSPSASSRKRKAALQLTVEDVEDEGDPYVQATQTVPPRRPAHPPLDPNFSRPRRSPSPVRPRAGPRDVGSTLDRRSLWHDYYMALDRESEERAKEALRRAGMLETQTGRAKRARRGGTDVECRRVDVEARRTGTKHKHTDPDSEDWFKYFEDVYDSDTIEYQHRLEEAKRYGIPISPPAIASERRRERKPSAPVVERRRRDAPERKVFPCFSGGMELKPLTAVNAISGGRWSKEEGMRRAMKEKEKEVEATVVETTYTHKPEVVDTTSSPMPSTAQNLNQNTPSKPAVVQSTPAFKPATVQTTPTPPTAQNPPRQPPAQPHPQPFLSKTLRPRTHIRRRSNPKKPKKSPTAPWFVLPQPTPTPTPTPTPLTAQNLSRFQTMQDRTHPLVKSRRRPSFDSLYNVSTGSSRRAEKKGTLRDPAASKGAAREPWVDGVDAEEQEAIMASLEETGGAPVRGSAMIDAAAANAQAQRDRDAKEEEEAIMAAYHSFLAARNVPVLEATGHQALDKAIAEAQAGSVEHFVEERRRKRASYARWPVERRDWEGERREEGEDAMMLRLWLGQVRDGVIERFRNGGA